MHVCSFCGKEIKPGKGLMVVAKDGSIKYYCSSKCEKNSVIRNPRKVRWTKIYREEIKPRNK